MRKNKIISSSSKTKLKLKTQNTQKNNHIVDKKQKQQFNEQYYPTTSYTNIPLKRNKILSSRNSLSTDKNRSQLYNHGKKQVQKKMTKKISKSQEKITIYCQNDKILKDLQILGVKSSKKITILIQIQCLKQFLNKKTNKNTIIISTLDEFTQIYVKIIQDLIISSKISANNSVQPNNNKYLKWFILSTAINSRSISQSFKQSYPLINFHFTKSIFEIITNINLFLQLIISINEKLSYEENWLNNLKQNKKLCKFSPEINLNTKKEWQINDIKFDEIIHLKFQDSNSLENKLAQMEKGCFSYLNVKQKVKYLDDEKINRQQKQRFETNSLYLCQQNQYMQWIQYMDSQSKQTVAQKKQQALDSKKKSNHHKISQKNKIIYLNSIIKTQHELQNNKIPSHGQNANQTKQMDNIRNFIRYLISQNKFTFVYFIQNQTHIKNNKQLVEHKNLQLQRIINFDLEQRKFIDKLLNSFQSIFNTKKGSYFQTIKKQLGFNGKEIFKILKDFDKKSSLKRGNKVKPFFLIFNQQTQLFNKESQTNQLSSITISQQYLLIVLFIKQSLQTSQFIRKFAEFIKHSDNLQTCCQYFYLNQTKAKIQQTKQSYSFNQIQLIDVQNDNSKDVQNIDNSKNTNKIQMILNQCIRRIEQQSIFKSLTTRIKDISKKLAIYEIQRCNQIYKTKEQKQVYSPRIKTIKFIEQLCYWLHLKKQLISTSNSLKQSATLKSSLSTNFPTLDIKSSMIKTKNKINILFGRIQNQRQKNQLFKEMLVIYLPKTQKISMEKLIKTINKAYEKYFSLIQNKSQQKDCQEIQERIEVCIFNIPSFESVFLNFQKQFHHLRQNELLSNQIIKKYLSNHKLAQFQPLLNNINYKPSHFSNSKSSKQKGYKNKPFKQIYYFLFQMQQFSQQKQKSIDNIRMKCDYQIEIYLKYGEGLIYRPKDGKYKFIKYNDLRQEVFRKIIKIEEKVARRQVIAKIDEVSQQRQQQNRLGQDLQKEQYSEEENFHNKMLQINLMINNESNTNQCSPLSKEDQQSYQDNIDVTKYNENTQKQDNLKEKNKFQQIKPFQIGRVDKEIGSKFQHATLPGTIINKRGNQCVKLYIFVHKVIPLRCLQYRKNKNYKILTYNYIQQPYLFLPYIDQKQQFMIIIKKKKQNTKQNKNNITQNCSKTNKSYQQQHLLGLRQKQSDKQEKNVVQKMRNNLQVIELKQMSQKQVINLIDTLIFDFKLEKVSEVNKEKKYINFTNIVIYQNYTSLDSNKKDQQNKKNSIIKEKQWEQLIEGDTKIKKHQQFEDFRQGNQKLNFQKQLKNICQKNNYFQKFFFMISETQFRCFFNITDQTTINFDKINELKVRFIYFGSQNGFKIFTSLNQNIKLKQKLNLLHLSSIKSLLLEFFNPYIKPIPKKQLIHCQNTLPNYHNKISITPSFILSKIIENQTKKTKVSEKLWMAASQSKNKSQNSIKLSISLKKSSFLSISNTQSMIVKNNDSFYESKNSITSIDAKVDHKSKIKENKLANKLDTIKGNSIVGSLNKLSCKKQFQANHKSSTTLLSKTMSCKNKICPTSSSSNLQQNKKSSALQYYYSRELIKSKSNNRLINGNNNSIKNIAQNNYPQVKESNDKITGINILKQININKLISIVCSSQLKQKDKEHNNYAKLNQMKKTSINRSIKTLKIEQYFSSIDLLVQMLWENATNKTNKKYLIVLISEQDIIQLKAKYFASQNQQNLPLSQSATKIPHLSLNNVIFIIFNNQHKNDEKYHKQKACRQFLKTLIISNPNNTEQYNQQQYPHNRNSQIYVNSINQIQSVILQIQNQINEQLVQFLKTNSCSDPRKQNLTQLVTRQMSRILNINQKSTNNKITFVIFCYSPDYQYLQSMIQQLSSVTYHHNLIKNSSSSLIKTNLFLQQQPIFHLFPVQTYEQLINYNSEIIYPHCIILPQQWNFKQIKVSNNALLIDYNRNHFINRLGIYVNNVINQWMKRNIPNVFGAN